MNNQRLRDVILIGTVIVVVLVILLVSLLLRKPSEIAYIKYNNKTLFQVKLDNGAFVASTSEYKVLEEPTIVKGKLYIGDVLDERLAKGEGVIVYQNTYVILGNLDYIMIEYNPTKKTIRVKEETSPYNICSKQGESKTAPIICLPNLVTISFGKSPEVDVEQ